MAAEPPGQTAAEFTLTAGAALTVNVPEPLPAHPLLSVTTTL
jgi:hypothetical protein